MCRPRSPSLLLLKAGILFSLLHACGGSSDSNRALEANCEEDAENCATGPTPSPTPPPLEAPKPVVSPTPSPKLYGIEGLRDRWGLWDLHRLTTDELIDFKRRYGPSVLYYSGPVAKKLSDGTNFSEALDFARLRDAGFMLVQYANALQSGVHSTRSRVENFDIPITNAQAKQISKVIEPALFSDLDPAIQELLNNPYNDGIALDAEYDGVHDSCDIEASDYGLLEEENNADTRADCAKLASLYLKQNGSYVKTSSKRYYFLKEAYDKLTEKPKRHRRLDRLEQAQIIKRYFQQARTANKFFVITWHATPNSPRYALRAVDFLRWSDVVLPFIYGRQGHATYLDCITAKLNEWKVALKEASEAQENKYQIPPVYPLIDHGRSSRALTPADAVSIPTELNKAKVKHVSVFVPHIAYYCTIHPKNCDKDLGPTEPASYPERTDSTNLKKFLDNLNTAFGQ